ncbi:MAG: hypothetical protein ACREBC_25730 [Pyrinomonadaceae bacterium]
MQAPFNDLYATSVDVMKRLAECNWHAWDRFTEQWNKRKRLPNPTLLISGLMD